VERTEVAVVGAGLLGSATARTLAARGVPVLLFEQFGLGHDRGSSHGATRIFRYSYPDPCYVEMAVRASEAWARLSADAGEELLVRTGGLDAGPGAGDCADALAECGVEHAWLTGAQVRDRFGGIGARPGERMLFQPDSGVCLAGRTVAALQRLAGRDGAAIRAGTPVLGIEAGRDQVLLRTAADEVTARTAVITAGPWAQGVLAGALPQAPRLTVTVQQVRYYAPRDPAASWPTLIEWPPEGLCWYAVPAVGGAPGVKVAAHIPGRLVDPRDGPFTEIDPALEEEAAGYVRDRLPGLDPAGLAAETCLYTMTSDEDFVLDRAGPLVIGGGCSGHAFKFGPLLGEFLADLALGQDIPVPRERFALRRPSLTVS
jgi:monomeric sarcosine oxidase